MRETWLMQSNQIHLFALLTSLMAVNVEEDGPATSY